MPGLIRGVARTAAVVGTASAVNGRVQRHQQQKFNDQDQAAYDQQMAQQQAAQPQYAPPPPPAAPAAPAADPIEQLTKLGELHAAGVLTDEEFAVQKNKILNG